MRFDVKYNIFSIIISTFLILITGAFIYILYDAKFFDFKLLLIAAAVFFVLILVVFLLSFNIKKKVKTIIAILLAIIILAIQVIGSYFIIIGKNTLEDIATSEPEYYEIGVFVRIEDKASVIGDIADYTFGILDVLDRKSTDFSINKIVENLGSEIDTQEYIDIAKLMDALISTKEIDAIILNKSLLNLLDEFEEHQEDLIKIKEIFTIRIDSNTNIDNIEKPVDKHNDDVFTAYISGIDCYGSVSNRSRSDANVIATVNIKTGQILLVSTPRDYYVPLSISNGIPDKLTHAGIYGVEVSKETHEMLYDIDIDYYFKVNFDGFKNIIDALGGITVYSEYYIKKNNNVQFQKGYNELNGELALTFARARKQVTGGARQRAKNHMAVIEGVINKATSPAIITNYKSVLNSATNAFETDMPYKMITKLIQNQLKNGTKWNITSYSVDGTGTYRQPYSLGFSAYVMIPDETTVEKAKDLMAAVRNGEIPVA